MSGTAAGVRRGSQADLAFLKVFARESVLPEEIKEFCGFILRCPDVSVKTYKLMLYLACRRPAERLAFNLQSIAACAASREIKKVRTDGVTPDEFAALNELDSQCVPMRLREVGHGLLNMHSRWVFAQALKRPIFEAHKESWKYLGSVTLDDVLGDHDG